MHGGKSLHGYQTPHFRTGRHSKYLPAHLLDKYESSRSDPDLLSLRDEVSLLDSMLADAIDRIQSGGSATAWIELVAAQQDRDACQLRRDVAGALAASDRIRSLIEDGSTAFAAMDAVANLIERRRKVVESERRRMIEMQLFISSDQAVGWGAALVNLVLEHVTEPLVRQQIVDGYSQLINRPEITSGN